MKIFSSILLGVGISFISATTVFAHLSKGKHEAASFLILPCRKTQLYRIVLSADYAATKGLADMIKPVRRLYCRTSLLFSKRFGDFVD